jgi:hypothetical protein
VAAAGTSSELTGKGAGKPVAETGTAESAEAGAAVEVPDSFQEMDEALPPLEDLVKRISPEVLATMEELFRARWTSVRRLKQDDLKSV